MASQKVPRRSDADQIARLLDSPEIVGLIADLDALRVTGRHGYPTRTLVGMALIKSRYALPTWTRAVRLVREHDSLRDALGCESTPSEWACYRFTRKLRKHSAVLAACLDRVTAALHVEHTEMGRDVAIDGSDLPAYANGQRHVSNGGKLRERFSDTDASWGHRSAISTRKGGGYYGYKVHAAVCVIKACRSHGRWRRRRPLRRTLASGCSTRPAPVGSPRARRSWTRGMTTSRSTRQHGPRHLPRDRAEADPARQARRAQAAVL